MREIRIFQEGDYRIGDSFDLSEIASRHVGAVLRMKPGQRITLFSGNNQEFQAEIVKVQRKKVTIVIKDLTTVNRESPLNIHLAQAVSKGDRMEWVVQKAVELGVSQISPVITEHSVLSIDEERFAKKIRQWQAIAISACEQCGRNKVPKIHNPELLLKFLERNLPARRVVMDPEIPGSWSAQNTPENAAVLLVGPEGGFSENELVQITAHKFTGMNLGPRILRTETAAVSGLTLLQSAWGDLQENCARLSD